MNEAVETLKQHLAGLPAKDRPFAESLIKQWTKSALLSDKQLYWVTVLASRAQGIPDFTREETDVGEFSGVIELFKKAGVNLKYPCIVLQTEAGQKVTLKPTGASSKYPGAVNVTNGGSYATNKWYGRVDVTGKFVLGPEAAHLKNDLTAILVKLAKSPHRVAAEHGKMTGACCFCNSKLTDPKSTEVGYGPVCAKQWSLPWGKAEAATVV